MEVYFQQFFLSLRSVAPVLGKTGLAALGGLASEGVSQIVKKILGRGYLFNPEREDISLEITI